jgi:hypothetical protein
MAQKSYTPFSTFWGLLVPAVIFGVVWYAYNSHGWVSYKVQAIVRPVVDPAIRFFARVL